MGCSPGAPWRAFALMLCAATVATIGIAIPAAAQPAVPRTLTLVPAPGGSIVETTIPLHMAVLSEPAVINGEYDIRWLENFIERLKTEK